MADATATFALNLDADMGAAGDAAGDLDLMKTAIQSDIRELNALKRAMGDVQKGATVDISAFRAMQERAKELTKSIAKGQTDFVRLGGSFASAEKGVSGLDATTKKALGPMGEQFERLSAIKDSLSGLSAGTLAASAGVAVFVVAIVAAAAAVGYAVVAIGQLVLEMAKFALQSSDAALKTEVMLEALTGSAGAASDLGSTIASVSSKVTVSSAKVTELATNLYKAGKRGAELEEALYLASLEADGLKGASLETVQKRMRSLEVQSLKFKQNLSDIFSGPSTRKAVGGFLDSMKNVLEVFDTSTESGKALQSLVSVMLDPLFNAASTVGPYVKTMFKGLVVGALLIAVAVLRARNAISDAFGDTSIFSGIDLMNVAFYAGIVVAGLIVVALLAVAAAAGFVALAVAAVVLAFAVMAIPVLLVVAAIGLVIAALIGVGYAIVTAVGWLWDLGAAGVEAAGNLIDGLAGGITSGAGLVYDAIRSMASGLVSTLQNALQMHSPSAIFDDMGDTGIAGGVVQGVGKGKKRVDAAVESLVSIPSVPTPSSPKASGSGAQVTVQLSIVGGSPAEQAEKRTFLEQFCETIEDGLGQSGIPLTLEVA